MERLNYTLSVLGMTHSLYTLTGKNIYSTDFQQNRKMSKFKDLFNLNKMCFVYCSALAKSCCPLTAASVYVKYVGNKKKKTIKTKHLLQFIMETKDQHEFQQFKSSHYTFYLKFQQLFDPFSVTCK